MHNGNTLQPAHHAPSSSYIPSASNPTPTLPPLAHPQSLDPETFTPPTSLLPKLFTTLANRYAARPGGYTRIHKFGRRPGDNAPHAILTLVDGPRDLKFEMTARTVGKESLDAMDEWERIESSVDEWEGLSEKSKRDVAKVLRYRSEDDRKLFKAKATEFSVSFLPINFITSRSLMWDRISSLSKTQPTGVFGNLPLSYKSPRSVLLA